MGIFDRLFGRSPSPQPPQHEHGAPGVASDEQALARYRYLLRTAPPEAIEQAHAEAFAQLTPEQRARALRELSQEMPPSERAGATHADPQTLARLATRAELRQPGTLERALGGRGLGMGMGMGGMIAGSLLSSIAGTFIGTAIAQQFLGGFHGAPETGTGETDSAHAETSDGQSDSDFEDGGDDFGGGFEDV
jgi:hypothetical protein